MDKYANFDVPPHVLEDFVAEVIANGMTASTGKLKKSGDYVVTVAYDKDQEEDIDTLEEYLDQLIDEADEDDDDDEGQNDD